jgi:prepilin-type N-terminal cleavage/methylation domain-containing protein
MKNVLKKNSGFTIIEVMIVLAIAGLIMVIVFLAVPQLQRSQRNEARKSIINRVSAEINNYASNNQGNIPTTAALFTGFVTRYLSGIDIKDPSTGTNLVVNGTYSKAGLTGSAAPTGPQTSPIPGGAQYADGAICAGEFPTTAGAKPRNFAIWSTLEGGGGTYCIDNH